MIGTERGYGWKVVGYLGMLLAIALIGLPLVWIVLTSFKQHSDIYSIPVEWWPGEWQPENYRDATERVPFADYFRNSDHHAHPVHHQDFLASSRLRCRSSGSRAQPHLHPGHLRADGAHESRHPNYALASQLGWRDTQGIIVPLAGTPSARSSCATTLFIFEIIEAARMDGAAVPPVVPGAAAHFAADAGGVLDDHRRQRGTSTSGLLMAVSRPATRR